MTQRASRSDACNPGTCVLNVAESTVFAAAVAETKARAIVMKQTTAMVSLAAVAASAIAGVTGVDHSSAVAEQSRATTAAAVASTIVASLPVQQTLAPARAARSASALGANALHMADQPVNRAEGQTGRSLNGTLVVLGV